MDSNYQSRLPYHVIRYQSYYRLNAHYQLLFHQYAASHLITGTFWLTTNAETWVFVWFGREFPWVRQRKSPEIFHIRQMFHIFTFTVSKVGNLNNKFRMELRDERLYYNEQPEMNKWNAKNRKVRSSRMHLFLCSLLIASYTQAGLKEKRHRSKKCSGSWLWHLSA